jgi:hypothetical protein
MMIAIVVWRPSADNIFQQVSLIKIVQTQGFLSLELLSVSTACDAYSHYYTYKQIFFTMST